MTEKTPLGRSLEALGIKALEGQEHPSPNRLIAYVDGGLSAADRDAVRAHLALCPSCAGYVLDYAHFDELGARVPGEALSDEEVEADWQAVAARVGLPAKRPSASVVQPRPCSEEGGGKGSRSWRERVGFWQLLAAASFTGLLILGAWNQSLSHRLAATGRGEPRDIDLVVLHDQEEIERGVSGQGGEPVIVSDGGPVVLHLVVSEPGSSEDYVAEIDRVEEGRQVPVWEGQAFSRTVSDLFIFLVPEGYLGPGSYQLRLSSLTEAGEVPLATYPFRVEAPGD